MIVFSSLKIQHLFVTFKCRCVWLVFKEKFFFECIYFCNKILQQHLNFSKSLSFYVTHNFSNWVQIFINFDKNYFHFI